MAEHVALYAGNRALHLLHAEVEFGAGVQVGVLPHDDQRHARDTLRLRQLVLVCGGRGAYTGMACVNTHHLKRPLSYNRADVPSGMCCIYMPSSAIVYRFPPPSASLLEGVSEP